MSSLVAQMVKNLPALLETWVQFVGCEDPLEEGDLHSMENPHGKEEPGGL